MASVKEETYRVLREGKEEILKIDASTWPHSPSIEDNAFVMASVVEQLIMAPGIKRVVFHQHKNFTYPYDQIQLLVEIGGIYNHLVRGKKILSLSHWGYDQSNTQFFGEKLAELQYIVATLLRGDPVSSYVETHRLLREERIMYDKEQNPELQQVRSTYIQLLQYTRDILERSKLITRVREEIAGHHVGDRTIYRNLFHPTITPDFMYTRLRNNPPSQGEERDFYRVGEHDITLYSTPNDIKTLYHITPVEFKLTEDEYELLDLARNVLAAHKPRDEEFLDPSRLRTTFYNVGKDLLDELAKNKKYDISYERILLLARILVRYTIGFGLVEVLLQDPQVQDITINSPVGASPIFLVHQQFGDCVTNIMPNIDDAESWATKLRLLSARPLDEANPILDTELIVPGARSRVSTITRPLSPTGLSFSFRRHRDAPWTLPLFIDARMISPLAAGLLSFLIDGARTMLFAGTRSSGKTSLLGSSLVEIMRKYRIITVEDTLELPVQSLRQLGYNIQHMKVRSSLSAGGAELSADDGIRTSLRLGDSSLIVGEVRSVEAKALYEAMRVGALANVVAGTIHGADPYGVYDRVVNDLGVPKTSFKATDIIVVSNPIKSTDGLQSWKRVLQITEVRKHWTDDPLREKGFVDLLKYDTHRDELVPTDDLLNGDSEVLKSIAANVREWAGDWDALWENILLRAKLKQTLVNYAQKSGNKSILESPFVVASNDEFHRLVDETRTEVGATDTRRVFRAWEDWLKQRMKHLPALTT